jgi:hypothetical protein
MKKTFFSLTLDYLTEVSVISMVRPPSGHVNIAVHMRCSESTVWVGHRFYLCAATATHMHMHHQVDTTPTNPRPTHHYPTYHLILKKRYDPPHQNTGLRRQNSRETLSCMLHMAAPMHAFPFQFFFFEIA